MGDDDDGERERTMMWGEGKFVNHMQKLTMLLQAKSLEMTKLLRYGSSLNYPANQTTM
jgi:hypothetical protein